MAVAFLCTKVQNPDIDDCKNLACIMKYLHGTNDLKLTIETSDNPKWWVDSSYAIHLDMRSHSRIYMTLLKWAYNSMSSKQKRNTKSLTEAEQVAIDDSMAQVLRTRHFLEEQGKPVPWTTTYQDNKSTIILAENGKTSSSRRTKHLDISFFCHIHNQERRDKDPFFALRMKY